MKRLAGFIFAFWFCLALRERTTRHPPPAREFRGLWVATVNNVDWPSRSGLPSRQHPPPRSELLAIFDRAVSLHFNAILLQVRPNCDALYDSKIEPWSEYITGVMGRAPFPITTRWNSR